MATIVAFHAHPDDEVLLTGGTIARLAAEGHRVIIVVACDGDVWASPDHGPGRRLDELRVSAAILGADRAVHLGYADSGHGLVLFEDPPGRTRFAGADVEEAAGKLAALLAGEHADLLLSYDPQGGYGHRDHVRVHRVGARAGEVAGVRVVEATVPRELVARSARVLLLLRVVTRHRLDEMRGYGIPRSAITHRVDVHRYAVQSGPRWRRTGRRCPAGEDRPGCSVRWSGRPCRYSGSPAGRSGSPNPEDGGGNSLPVTRRPGFANRISAQPQLPVTGNSQVRARYCRGPKSLPKSGANRTPRGRCGRPSHPPHRVRRVRTPRAPNSGWSGERAEVR